MPADLPLPWRGGNHRGVGGVTRKQSTGMLQLPGSQLRRAPHSRAASVLAVKPVRQIEPIISFPSASLVCRQKAGPNSNARRTLVVGGRPLGFLGFGPRDALRPGMPLYYILSRRRCQQSILGLMGPCKTIGERSVHPRARRPRRFKRQKSIAEATAVLGPRAGCLLGISSPVQRSAGGGHRPHGSTIGERIVGPRRRLRARRAAGAWQSEHKQWTRDDTTPVVRRSLRACFSVWSLRPAAPCPDLSGGSGAGTPAKRCAHSRTYGRSGPRVPKDRRREKRA